MTNNKLKISKQKKQIIVTGGLGFVGQHLTQALIKHDYLPIVVDKLPSSSVKKVINRYNLKVNKDFIFLKGDIRNTKWLEKKLKIAAEKLSRNEAKDNHLAIQRMSKDMKKLGEKHHWFSWRKNED